MEDITNLLADKMFVLPKIESVKEIRSGKFHYRMCKTVIHSVNDKEFKKMNVRKNVQLCKPFSITAYKDTRFTQDSPELIDVKRRNSKQNTFKLNLVPLQIQDARTETQKRDFCSLRLPMSKKHIDSAYQTVLESLSRDLFYAFAEPKLQDNMSTAKYDCAIREINMDILNFIKSFDAIEIVYDEMMPLIHDYKGFGKFGIEEDCVYAHYYVCFYRLSEDNLVDSDTRRRVLNSIEFEKHKKKKAEGEEEQ